MHVFDLNWRFGWIAGTSLATPPEVVVRGRIEPELSRQSSEIVRP
jgi:hypothetical protein